MVTVNKSIDNEYLARMCVPGVWGDGTVLACACRLYNRSINVLMTNGSVIPFANEQHIAGDPDKKPILLGFVKTLGSITENHYVYLEKKREADANTSSYNGMLNIYNFF